MMIFDNVLVFAAAIVLCFLVITYIGYSVIDALWLRKMKIRRRIDFMTKGNDVQESEPEEQAVEGDPFPTIAKFISTRGLADRLLIMLIRAGIKLRPSEYIGVICGLALVLALLAVIFYESLPLVIAGIAIGLLAPFVYVKVLQERRLVAFNRQLPDTLSLISSATRSGYSVTRAMQMVADEMPEPISMEFQRVNNEVNVGLPFDAALTRMTQRVRSYDLELVVTAIIIQQQIGGNLAEIIDNIAETIRDRVRVEGELSALTAEGRISGVVLVLLPFVMAGIILILNPRYLSPLIHEQNGLYLIAAGVLLQAIGALIIKRMLTVDY